MASNTTSTPSATDRLLWWLATAEPELIRNCVVDGNRYRIVGCSVLATALFATLAWSYFFSTAVQNPIAYLLLGLFMGFVIVTIDRTLIKGINKNGKNQLGALLFRGFLAIAIGTFMAQPAVLYLFDKEVQLQASLDNEARRQTQLKAVEVVFAGKKAELLAAQNSIEQRLSNQKLLVEAARQNFLAETDGSGGSGKVGISTIALAKKREFEKLEAEYSTLSLKLKPQQDSLLRQLGGIADSIKTRQLQFATLLNNGFLTRIEALDNLVRSNPALAFRYYLIVALLMLIELMPVIAKTLLPTGSYDHHVRLQEAFEQQQWEERLDRDTALNKHFDQAARADGQLATTQFFEETAQRRQSKMKTDVNAWNQGG
ncbi:MAG: DUF4407 domain-containing protein [Bacteroidetes bacterium]|nr:MAG: DUF4407 domain-containing protein [Bacteroidota bacterium]